MALIDGLQHYWKCDETSGSTMSDSHGSEDGVNQSMEDADWITGLINNGINYDESPEHTIFSFTNTSTDGTFNFWIKPDADQNNFIMGNQQDGTSQGDWYFQLLTVFGVIRYQITKTGDVQVNLDSDVEPTAGAWNMITGLWGTGGMKLWVNGSEQTASDASSQIPTGKSGQTTWGLGHPIGNQDYYDGKFDEVGIWNKRLTQSEITSLYNSGNGLAYPFSTSAGFNQAHII